MIKFQNIIKTQLILVVHKTLKTLTILNNFSDKQCILP